MSVRPRHYTPPLARIPTRLRPGTLDTYLLQQAIPPFLIALSVVLIALLLERLLVLLNLLAAEASPIFTLVRLLADLMPHYMGLALPAALCVAVFAVVRRMSDNNEIDALMSSGVSLLRICRPFALAGAVLGVLSFLLYGYIQPHARYQFRQGFYLASHAGWAPVLLPGVFVAPSSGLVLRADHVGGDGSELTGVFIRDMSDGKERDIVAKTGHVRINARKGEAQVDLTDGSILTIPRKGPPSITWFDHATRLLSHARSTTFRERGDDERELTSGELRRHIRAATTGASPPAGPETDAGADPRSAGAKGNDTGSEVGSDTGGDTGSDIGMDTNATSATAAGNAVSTPPAAVPVAGTDDIPVQNLRAELHFRLARSLSIPFIPILAAALAIIGKRKRGNAGLAVAALLLVTYDHALQFGESLVATGRDSPFVVIWLPTLLFSLVCVGMILLRADILRFDRLPWFRRPGVRAGSNGSVAGSGAA